MRIGSVDVYKFFFSWIICFYHFYNAVSPNPHFPMGETVVELFVLISGVFFYMGWERTKENSLRGGCSLAEDISPYSFLKRRFLRFLPYTTIGFALAFGVRTWLYTEGGSAVSFQRVLSWLSDDIWEILLIKMNGMNDNSALLNVPAWTVSAMLIAEFFIIALLVYREKLFTTLICPGVIMLGLGLWRHIPKGNHEVWMGFTTFGLLRVFLLTCLAWYCWKLVQRMRAMRFTRCGSILLGICELLLYIGALAIMMNFDTRNFRWVVMMMFFFACAISISGASFTKALFPAGKVTGWLGEMSMGIYLTHYPIMRIYKHLWTDPYEMFEHKISFLVVVFAASVVFCVVTKYVARAAGRITTAIKGKVVQTS